VCSESTVFAPVTGKMSVFDEISAHINSHFMKQLALLSLLILIGSGQACQPGAAQKATPVQAYFEWSDLEFEASEYQARRRVMAHTLAGDEGGIFITRAHHGVSHGETFRQLNDFNYFTGLEVPNALLVIDASANKSILFVPESDFRFESPSRPNDFPGMPLLSDPEIAEGTGIGDIRRAGEAEEYLKEMANRNQTIWINWGSRGEIPTLETELLADWTPDQLIVLHLQKTIPGIRIRNAYDAIANLRMVKSAAEIEMMKRAAEITMRGIRHVATFISQGVSERDLEAELEGEFKRNGAQRLAFNSIIKSGPNSLWAWRILAARYDRRNREMINGDLVIFDVGCEYNYYSSDIGRTFPVSGTFSPEQRETLRMQVQVADAIIAAIQPGTTFRELTAAGQAEIPEDQRLYMQVGLYYGHHIGLSVGDPNLPDVPLQPGMIFTVEPWYYNHDRDLSVFTEDIVLVTEDGCEVLTRDLPRSPEELEALMR
jgi:Xaa-Pro aminopeptidase